MISKDCMSKISSNKLGVPTRERKINTEKSKNQSELSRSQTFPLRRKFQAQVFDAQHEHSTLRQKMRFLMRKKTEIRFYCSTHPYMQLPAAAGTMTHPPAVAKKTQPPAIKNGNAESIIIAKKNNELATPAPKGASAHNVPSSNSHSAIEKQNELINNKKIDIRQLDVSQLDLLMMAATITKINANSKKIPLCNNKNFENVFSVKQHTLTMAGSCSLSGTV
jgi:hypothetical protein